MAKKGKYRGSSLKSDSMVSMYGVAELLRKIEKAHGRIDEAAIKATDESLKVIGNESQRLMARLSPGEAGTGDTYRSYEQQPAKMNGKFVQASLGYNIDEGGLPAIFLDVGWKGTPKREPKRGHFWRYYAVANTRKQVKEVQQKALNEILEGLK